VHKKPKVIAGRIRIPPKIKNYFRNNPGALFIIGFQVLLLVCAGLLFQGNSVLVDEVAVCAYFLLVIGVVLQLIFFVRREKEDKQKLKEVVVI